MTIYFVSGFMRTGTSMMMKALEAGGLDVLYNPDRDKMNTRYGDEYYQPNEGGFYELNRRQYQQPGFPRMHEGKLIKALWGGITRVVAGDYKVVFMRRDYEEIRQSYQAFFGNPIHLNAEEYRARMDDTIGMLKVRRDVGLSIFQYRDVLDHPLEKFAELRDQGWPVDVHKAAAVVSPSTCRFRLEELQVGV